MRRQQRLFRAIPQPYRDAPIRRDGQRLPVLKLQEAIHQLAPQRLIGAEARKRITVAADYTRDEQIGRAVMRLDDLYAKSIAGHDIKTALQAQRELNRLLDLYAGSARTESISEEEAAGFRRQVELIASYLLPLKLVGENYPIEEHARVAADLIRRMNSERTQCLASHRKDR